MIVIGEKSPLDPELIRASLLELRSACAEGKIAIALEQRRGPLFYQLCSHLNWIDLYPVNPLFFESLPGAGQQFGPRLLALFGSDRSRWAGSMDIQKFSEIAPVIERSGKSVWVHRRFSRPIFICQTFHEFAQQTMQHSSWAEQFYRRQRQKGKSHHSAVRALAFKWIRILCACWKANKPYDECRYLRALQRKAFSVSAA